MIKGKSSAVMRSFLSPNSMIRWVTFLSSSSFRVKPNSCKFFSILAFPEVFPSAYFRLRPKRSGRRLLKYKFFFESPSAWIPAVCVNTFSPTMGLLAGTRKPVRVATN